MPHFQDQHEPVDIRSGVILTAAQMDDLKQFLTDLVERKSVAPAVLSDDQFQKLIAMLQPGFELSNSLPRRLRA